MKIKLLDILSWKISSIIEINSNNPWKTTTIMVWVHWNEKSWQEALVDILKGIKIISWKVYFIFANLRAIELNQRFYEKNMNRCFLYNIKGNTYEENRVKEIIPYLEKSDYLLDVHNTLNKNNSIPFLISEHRDLSMYFDVEKVICWLDNLHPWWSDGFMNSIEKVWLCLESWSISDLKWTEIAKWWILNFLKLTGNIAWTPTIRNWQELIKLDFIYKNKTINFRFSKKFLDFEKVPAWFVIAYDGEEKIKFDEEKIILFIHDIKSVWEECFCIGNIL